MLTRVPRARPFSTTAARLLLGNLFGSKEAKNRELIEKQDEYEVDPTSKITILNKENSPSYKPFLPETDMPGFKINQWKDRFVRAQDLESTFDAELVSQAINETYSELSGTSITSNDYKSTLLGDLQFRFAFAKALQKKLGFDIGDYTISKSHDVEMLFAEVRRMVAHRWSSERNPNAIVLRPEDFAQSPNVYLNNERSEEEQQAVLAELKEKVLVQ